MAASQFKNIGIASLIMMFSVFLSRVIGLFREMIIAYIGGAGGDVDAYQVAFVVPEILNHILASGFLSVTFIPIFSKYLVSQNENEGWRVFSNILNIFGCLMLVLIALATGFTPYLIDLLAPGLADDPLLKQSAVRMTRIIMPAQFFFFTGGLFSAVQFSKEKFVIPAFAPLIYNIGIIAGGVLLGPRMGMEGFAWGVLAGAFGGNFLLQWWGARKAGMVYRTWFNVFHPDLKTYIRLTLPLMLGLTMTFSTEILMKFFGSFLPRGNIAGLNYGIRVMYILVGLFGQAVGVASFPFMAKLAAENKIDQMNDLLNRTLKLLSVVIPISVLFMVLRHEIVLVLFQRGKFDAEATRITSQILACLLVGTFAFSAQTIVVRGYYAVQNTLFPALFGTLAVMVSVPLYVGGMYLWGVLGIALAISFSVLFQTLLLFATWSRKTANRGAASVYGFFVKIILLSIPLGLVLEWIKQYLSTMVNTGSVSGCLFISMAMALIFLAFIALAGYVFKLEEVLVVINRLISAVVRKNPFNRFMTK